MKKLILGALLLLSTITYSQLQKVELPKPTLTTKIAPMGSFSASADFYEDGVEITFQDAEFTKITAIRRFRLSIEDFNSLGQVLTSKENKVDDFYTIRTLDGKELYFKFSKSMGYIYPIILLKESHVNSRFPNLTIGQFKKLFNIK